MLKSSLFPLPCAEPVFEIVGPQEGWFKSQDDGCMGAEFLTYQGMVACARNKSLGFKLPTFGDCLLLQHNLHSGDYLNSLD